MVQAATAVLGELFIYLRVLDVGDCLLKLVLTEPGMLLGPSYQKIWCSLETGGLCVLDNCSQWFLSRRNTWDIAASSGSSVQGAQSWPCQLCAPGQALPAAVVTADGDSAVSVALLCLWKVGEMLILEFLPSYHNCFGIIIECEQEQPFCPSPPPPANELWLVSHYFGFVFCLTFLCKCSSSEAWSETKLNQSDFVFSV